MVPGMGHCSGGPGCNTWDKLAALANWVEHGPAPEFIVAQHQTNGQVDDQRRLCPFPQHAAYVGPAGGQNDRVNWIDRNFTCS
jgi:feruloyl esterase